MRSKKESAVSTRLSEAPTAHSSTAIAAALHGGKAARGALLARWWQRTLQAPRDPCIFSAASPTLCAARWSACMAQLRYHTERQRVSERGTWARSREQTSGSGERTSSHDNAFVLQEERTAPLRTERRALQRALFRFLPCREPCSCPQALPPSHHRTCVAHSLWASTGVEGYMYRRELQYQVISPF